MTRSEDILGRLRSLRPTLKQMGMRRVRVYGSVARGEAGADSDVDLLVDFDRIPGLIAYIGVKYDLEEKLGCRVDLHTEDALHPLLKDKILAEARDV